MGFFNKDDEREFGDLFELNGDGKTSLEEEVYGYQMLEIMRLSITESVKRIIGKAESPE